METARFSGSAWLFRRDVLQRWEMMLEVIIMKVQGAFRWAPGWSSLRFAQERRAQCGLLLCRPAQHRIDV